MTELDLIVDLHKDGHRQGPGGDDETQLAVALSGLKDKPNLKIADIGCGTGASTLVLARELDAQVMAVDFLPAFLERLASEAEAAGLPDRVTTQAVSMDALTFAPSSLDAIWAEGAIYNIGFETGVRAWREFLKPGGILAVSELTWLTDVRPAELEAHWTGEYPEVATASAKMAILEQAGYAPLGYFPLPKACWLDNYYRPMQARFPVFLERHDQSKAAQAIVRAEQAEIDLYERYSDYFGYGYYVARRTAD
ncbi:MAG: methyltransferase domain-containing protein [Pseudomonadota bacterium]